VSALPSGQHQGLDWSDADRLKAQAALDAERDVGPWRTVCYVGRWRVQAREGDFWLRFQRPCDFVRGKWRFAGLTDVKRLAREASRWHLNEGEVDAVVVERDVWLSEGARVRTSPRNLRPGWRGKVAP
jgi:hypothetical protein